MADLGITSTNVQPGGTDCRVQCVELGEACTAGEQVYRDSGDGLYYRGDNSASNKASVRGTLITGGLINEFAVLAYEGPVVVGATTGHVLAQGDLLVLADNAGKMMPDADWTTGDLETYCAYGLSATEIQVAPNATGVVN